MRHLCKGELKCSPPLISHQIIPITESPKETIFLSFFPPFLLYTPRWNLTFNTARILEPNLGRRPVMLVDQETREEEERERETDLEKARLLLELLELRLDPVPPPRVPGVPSSSGLHHRRSIRCGCGGAGGLGRAAKDERGEKWRWSCHGRSAGWRRKRLVFFFFWLCLCLSRCGFWMMDDGSTGRIFCLQLSDLGVQVFSFSFRFRFSRARRCMCLILFPLSLSLAPSFRLFLCL